MNRFAEIQSVILAARDSADLPHALRLAATAVRQLREHQPSSPEQVDAAWIDQWQTTMRALGDLLDHSLLPSGEQIWVTTRRQERLHELAYRDPLTGLGNRRVLERRLADAAADIGTMPGAVAMIDLDGFKAVNDTHSHAVGDAVLVAIAETMCASLRTTDPGRDTVIRYGGDEFVAVLASTPPSVAVAALKRATRAVAALPTTTSLGVTLSVGVVALDPGVDPDEALRAADAAMYAAKRRGGNAVCCAADA